MQAKWIKLDLGMNSKGLKISPYATPYPRVPVWLSLICGPQIRIVWFSMLSDTDNNYMYLEKVQRTVTRIIFPDIEYEQRIQFLDVPLLYDFLKDLHVNDRAKFVFHFFYVSP